jgi:hypothetical protein
MSRNTKDLLQVLGFYLLIIVAIFVLLFIFNFRILAFFLIPVAIWFMFSNWENKNSN